MSGEQAGEPDRTLLLPAPARFDATRLDDDGTAWTPTVAVVALLEVVANGVDPAGARSGEHDAVSPSGLRWRDLTREQIGASIRNLVDRGCALVDGLRAGQVDDDGPTAGQD